MERNVKITKSNTKTCNYHKNIVLTAIVSSKSLTKMVNKMTNEAKLIHKTDFQYTYMINGTLVTIEKINKKWEGFESQKIVLSPPSKYLIIYDNMGYHVPPMHVWMYQSKGGGV